MSFVWVVIPFTFVLFMQKRSFIKMREEKIQLLLGGDEKLDETQLNASDPRHDNSRTAGRVCLENDSRYDCDRSVETLALTSKTPFNRSAWARDHLPLEQYDTQSVPQTTTSMKDYFEKCQNIDGSSRPPDIVEE